jgi:hypothetical protein
MNKSNILSKIRELFASEQFAADYPTIDGQTIRCLGDALRVGEKVVKIVSGEEKPAEDGNYVLENGKSITIEAGQVKTIEDITEGNVSETGQIQEMGKQTPTKDEAQTIVEKMEDDYKNEIEGKLKDGTEVKVLSKGDAISVGDMVLVKAGEGYNEAPEGRHELEGGLVIYTDANGFINEIETEETDATTESDEMRKMFEALEQLTTVVSNLKQKFESVSNVNAKLTERFEKFAAEPSTKSISHKEAKIERLSSKADKAKFFGQI